MKLTKKIWFDENSMPPKDQIWYKGKGKFYEFKGGKWVVVYDLNSMPTQEEQEELVAAIQEKNPEFVVDKDKSLLPQILEGVINSIPVTPKQKYIFLLSDQSSEQGSAFLTELPMYELDSNSDTPTYPTFEYLRNLLPGSINFLLVGAESGTFLPIVKREDESEVRTLYIGEPGFGIIMRISSTVDDGMFEFWEREN